VILDTKNILFIAGAHSRLGKTCGETPRPCKSGIGFHASPVDLETKPELEELLNETQPGDLRQSA